MSKPQTFSIDGRRSALLLVDIQPDFMPGGSLAVSQGEDIVAPVNELMKADLFELNVATQDWHPPGHISFASSHPGRKPFEEMPLYGHTQILWPDHCLQGSHAAQIHAGIDQRAIAAVMRKGMNAEVDSYSGFRNNWNPQGERPLTGLAGYLRERKIRQLFICGLARDVCVRWTARDAAAAGFETWVIWDLTRPVDSDSDVEVRAELERAGVTIADAQQLRSTLP